MSNTNSNAARNVPAGNAQNEQRIAQNEPRNAQNEPRNAQSEPRNTPNDPRNGPNESRKAEQPAVDDRARGTTIEITHGSYVHRLPAADRGELGGHDVPALVGDQLEVSDREAKRLVALGVAKLAR